MSKCDGISDEPQLKYFTLNFHFPLSIHIMFFDDVKH